MEAALWSSSGVISTVSIDSGSSILEGEVRLEATSAAASSIVASNLEADGGWEVQNSLIRLCLLFVLVEATATARERGDGLSCGKGGAAAAGGRSAVAAVTG